MVSGRCFFSISSLLASSKGFQDSPDGRPKILSAEDHSIPIGRPIFNTQGFILDRDPQPTPIGVCGELFAGGNGLA